jgi:hypothetical protein
MRPFLAVLALISITLAVSGCGSTAHIPQSLIHRLRNVRIVRTIYLRPGEVRQFSRSMHVTGYDIECMGRTSGIGIVIQPDTWGGRRVSTAGQRSQRVRLTATPRADSRLTFRCTHRSA